MHRHVRVASERLCVVCCTVTTIRFHVGPCAALCRPWTLGPFFLYALDLTRYSAPHRVSDAVALPASVGRSPNDIAGVLKSFFRPQCHPVMLDAAINSVPVVVDNVCKLLLLVAAKLVCVLFKPQLVGIASAADLTR